MRHLKSGRKLKRTSSHRKALLRNLAMSLFEHKKIETTLAKAKELRPFAEKLITKAKVALSREKQGLLPEGQSIDIHSRRVVAREINRKAIVQELFDSIAPVVAERNGGYTRIIKTGFRRGDASDTAIIELVDWSNPQDGAGASKKTTKKKATTTKAKKAKVAEVKEVKEEVVETPVTEVVQEEVAPVEEVVAEVAVETPAEVVSEATETVEEVVAEPVAEEAPQAETKTEEPASEASADEAPTASAEEGTNSEEAKA